MRLPLLWLHDLCDPGLPAAALAERLDLTGTEVARIEHHGVGAPDGFVVGRVLHAEPHPNADRLRVCRVAVGEGDVAAIVCGAPNVAAGQTVAVARPGAVMPDGTRLKKAKLRGVASDGMILAEDELGIGTDHDGIMVLPEELVPGTPLADVLPLATDVLELEITPNRPDCLSVYGMAREVHAATGAPLAPAPWSGDPGSAGPVDGAQVVVEAPDLCPRFTARVFEDVAIGPSPPWLKARLMAAGQRPISNVVDITNYVMLLTGQPLHAFDLDRIAGGRLVVRRARAGEELETLDGTRRTLDPGMCAIADDLGVTSLAGVMGGARSEVEPTTTRVLMEAATWDGPTVQRTSTRLGVRSEASARFEKGLSPEATLEAQAVAAVLMVELCGASLRPGTIDVGTAGFVAPPVRLREARVAGLLGRSIPLGRCAEILRALGFAALVGDAELEARVPHFRRGDVSREADLVEEVARIDGLERLPATLPARRGASGVLTFAQRARRRAEDALVGRGVHEIAGWSFEAPDAPDRLRLGADDPRRSRVRLANPMAEDEALLRTGLVGSLLDAARHNVARGLDAPRLFESGAVYRDRGPDRQPDERHHLAALVVGAVRPPSWREPEPPPADVFAAKALLGGVLDTLRAPWTVRSGVEPFLHPGRTGVVEVAGAPVGWVGELHPLVAGRWDLPGGAGFEVDLGAVLAALDPVPVYSDLTSFPAVRQDLAVTVDEAVAAADVLAVVRRAGGPTLSSVDVFDVYRGEQAGAGRVSLALRLEFRAPDRTLTDEEVAGRRAAIVAALRAELGGEPRA